ncbi:MAG: glycosyl transferase [Pseudanabaenaceae cyanobacterium bins.68]|nr:glycosyl transferase [Pseudanabaenaceae cyanobacterium bins.68]
MTSLCVYFAITSHGFGHATRTAAVISALQTQATAHDLNLKVIVATTAPIWLLKSYISQPFIYHPVTLDIGVVQSDSFTMDKDATLAKWQELYHNQSALIHQELAVIRQHQVDLIFADLPPLASAIAQAAHIPCWAASNFGWDLIYQAWSGFEFIVEWITDLHRHCDLLLRLPFHEPMASFPQTIDCGFTGGSPKYSLELLRQEFNLSSDRPTALLTFGGLSLDAIPYHQLARFPEWQFLTFDSKAPELANLIKLNAHPDLRPVDFMPLCDRLIAKPGYSTLSEACRQQLPTICLTRPDFREAEYLLDGLRQYNHHLIISPQEFYESDWQFMHQNLQPPTAAQVPANQAEQAIARHLINYLNCL